MNKDRRKSLSTILTSLEALGAELSALHDEEEEAFESMPESLQDGDRGEAAQAAIENLEQAQSAIEEAKEYIETASE